jgi:multiple sugar transport system substrate-binding protein
MTERRTITRRDVLKAGAAVGGLAALQGADLNSWAQAWAQSAPWKPEKGAKLQVMRWKRFVQAEEDAFLALVAAFTKATGVPVTVVSESLDDVQPKASVAANTGQGPDIFWGLYSLPHLFAAKCMDVTDVADYLGKKYGGWVPSAVTYGKSGNRWIAIPVGYNANVINYRQSMIEKAGFKEIPKDNAGFMQLMKELKAKSVPGGFALGRASGDGNAWIHWCFWSHGANLVDEKDKVILNSPETVKALEYAKELSTHFVPGCAGWNDSFNNKAFLESQVSVTNNGVSIYAAAKANAGKDPKAKEVMDDMNHSLWPVGPAGKPTEFHICYPMLGMKYSKSPQAVKAFIAFTLEAENYNPWLQSAVAYITHPLNAYDANPVWTSDPKLSVARDAAKRTLTAGGLGSVGEKAASALADFVVLDMFASVCTDRATVKDAIAVAERQAKRIYR